MKFNTRILAVACIPLYGYLAICTYVFVQSQYRIDVLEPMSIVFVSVMLLMAGIFAAMQKKLYHICSVILFLIVGITGIYYGLLMEPMNWTELIASAFVIAYGLAFYEMVEHHREVWHERD